MSIASRILEARQAQGLTQEALALKIGVTKGAIGNYENGVSVPKIEIMFRLFEALGRDANYFYQDECHIPSVSCGATLSPDEYNLVNNYRRLSSDGKAYIQQTIAMAVQSYGKNHTVSDLADQA